MDKKIKFEFDLDEVFEGIEKGVVKQMSEMTFDGIIERGYREFQNRLEKELKNDYSEVKKIKEESVSNAVEILIDELRKTVLEKQETLITKNVSQLSESYAIKDKMEDIIQNVEDRIVQIKLSKEPKVTITREEYQKMQERIMLLDALESGGVDNWSGYDYSIENAKELDKEFRKIYK